MNEKVCPLCGARYVSLYRFCPLDASPLVDAEAPAPLAREPEIAAAPEPEVEEVVETPRGRGPVTRRVIKGGTKSRATDPEVAASPAAGIAAPDGVSVQLAAEVKGAVKEAPATRIEKKTRPTDDETRVAEAVPAAAAEPPKRREKRFSETEWFKRPIKDAEVDPESGRVVVSEDDYKADGTRAPEERRGYTLEKLDD